MPTVGWCSIRRPTMRHRFGWRCSGGRSRPPAAWPSTPTPSAARSAACGRRSPAPTSSWSASGWTRGSGPMPTRPRSRSPVIGGLADRRPYLLCLGRVDDGKGARALGRFFAAFKRRRPRPAGAGVRRAGRAPARSPSRRVRDRGVERGGQMVSAGRVRGVRAALGQRELQHRAARGVGGVPPGPGERPLRPDQRARPPIGRRSDLRRLRRVRDGPAAHPGRPAAGPGHG